MPDLRDYDMDLLLAEYRDMPEKILICASSARLWRLPPGK